MSGRLLFQVTVVSRVSLGVVNDKNIPSFDLRKFILVQSTNTHLYVHIIPIPNLCVYFNRRNSTLVPLARSLHLLIFLPH